MPSTAAPVLTARFAGFLLLTSLTACSNKPLVVSADTACERFRHISATASQRAFMAGDWPLWESLGVQIASHNTEYDKKCLGPKPGP